MNLLPSMYGPRKSHFLMSEVGRGRSGAGGRVADVCGRQELEKEDESVSQEVEEPLEIAGAPARSEEQPGDDPEEETHDDGAQTPEQGRKRSKERPTRARSRRASEQEGASEERQSAKKFAKEKPVSTKPRSKRSKEDILQPRPKKEKRKRVKDGAKSLTTSGEALPSREQDALPDLSPDMDLVDYDFVPSVSHSKYTPSSNTTEMLAALRSRPIDLGSPSASTARPSTPSDAQNRLYFAPEEEIPRTTDTEAKKKTFSMRNSIYRLSKSISHTSHGTKNLIQEGGTSPPNRAVSPLHQQASDRAPKGSAPSDHSKLASGRGKRAESIYQASSSLSELTTDKPLTNLPGMASNRERHRKKRNVIPRIHSALEPPPGPCQTLLLLDFEPSDLKFPCFLDCSSSYYQLAEITFLLHMSDIFKEIDLTSNSLREVKGISHLTKLKRLNLDGNRIGEIDIRGLNGLQFMSLRNNKINSLAPFSSLTHLVHLNVSGNPIQSGFDSLQYLTKLQLLYMKDCLIDMSGDEFSFVLLDTLASLKGLTHLAVTGNPAFDKNAKTLHPLFLQSLPGLLFFNEKETELQRKMIAPAANKSVPKSDREKKRLVSETLRNARTEGDHLTERVREFPEEALDSLFALLSPKDLISAAATCRKWRAAGVITLQSRLKRSLHRINVLSSNPTSNEVKQCLLEMGTLISDTSVRLQETPLSQFDLDLLQTQKVLIILCDQVDDEFFNIWEHFYEQLSFFYAQQLIVDPPPFPFVKYAIFRVDEGNTIIAGVDELLHQIGCERLFPTGCGDFGTWMRSLKSQLQDTYDIKS